MRKGLSGIGSRIQLGAAAALVTAGAALLLGACGDGGGGARNGAKPELETRDRMALAQQLDPAVAAASNAFGLELARRQMEKKPGENMVLSPVSVAQALAMTMNGAAGSTREGVAKALRLDGVPLEKVNQSAAVIADLLGKSSPGVRTAIANSLWLQKDWPFKNEFLKGMRESYKAKLEQRNLTDPKVRKEINDWVKKQTRGRIPSIVDEPVDPLTKAMLINALHLNAAWENPFQENQTKDGPFTRADGTVKQVPMMKRSGRMAYDEEDTHQAVKLPYGDGQLSMLIVLPRPGADRKALAAKLFADPAWWMRSYEGFSGELTLPRFRVEMTAELKELLAPMGMADAFDPLKADFRAMANTDATHEPLFISRVLHKTYLDVNEKGTEAAAATLVGMKAGSAPPNGRFEMKVDRPFWLAIVDEQSKLLLFVGAVEQP
ncbi:serpin family protein [Paenibacillus chartarius]|uniref:Serpin family protein n=1 Tax=Paenibacillus chartarius TaxID=747481 RepID=A0ABV6DGJ8_9BACL